MAAAYVDEQTKSRRVVLSKPMYTVQQVEVIREHPHRLVEDIQTDSVEPKESEFQKLKVIDLHRANHRIRDKLKSIKKLKCNTGNTVKSRFTRARNFAEIVVCKIKFLLKIR